MGFKFFRCVSNPTISVLEVVMAVVVRVPRRSEVSYLSYLEIYSGDAILAGKQSFKVSPDTSSTVSGAGVWLLL